MEEEKKNMPDTTEATPETAQTAPSQISTTPTPQEAEAVVVENSSTATEANQVAPAESQAPTQTEASQPSNLAPSNLAAVEESKEIPAEKEAPEVEEEKPAEDADLPETEVVAKSEEVKESTGSNLEQPRDFRRIARIIAVIAILIFFAWLINRESTKDNSSDSNVNITVDGQEQNGTVNIIDEVKGDIKIEDSSVTATRPLTGYVINAYYLNTKNDPEMKDCGKVYELKRQGERKYDSNIVNTVLGLLSPLSAEEQAQGFYSAIPANTFLQYVRLDSNGNMEANFSGQIAKAAGSCAVTAIRAQITQTLMQFANVKTVTICINGNCKQDEILQP